WPGQAELEEHVTYGYVNYSSVLGVRESCPTRRSSDLVVVVDRRIHLAGRVLPHRSGILHTHGLAGDVGQRDGWFGQRAPPPPGRSEEHTSELKSREKIVFSQLRDKN